MQNLVHLQGIGKVKGIPAKELRPGQKIMWNFGYIYEVVSVYPSKTGKSIVLTERYTGNLGGTTDKEYTRRLGANRLVAIVAGNP